MHSNMKPSNFSRFCRSPLLNRPRFVLQKKPLLKKTIRRRKS